MKWVDSKSKSRKVGAYTLSWSDFHFLQKSHKKSEDGSKSSSHHVNTTTTHHHEQNNTISHHVSPSSVQTQKKEIEDFSLG
jgi:hypothetical protein